MCVVLFAFGTIKMFLSGGINAAVQDPIFRVPEQMLGTVAGIIEILLGIWLARGGGFIAKISAAWLGGVFLLYHIFAKQIDPGFTCPCLGSEFSRLGIQRDTAQAISQLTAMVFTVAACTSVLVNRRPQIATDQI